MPASPSTIELPRLRDAVDGRVITPGGATTRPTCSGATRHPARLGPAGPGPDPARAGWLGGGGVGWLGHLPSACMAWLSS